MRNDSFRKNLVLEKAIQEINVFPECVIPNGLFFLHVHNCSVFSGVISGSVIYFNPQTNFNPHIKQNYSIKFCIVNSHCFWKKPSWENPGTSLFLSDSSDSYLNVWHFFKELFQSWPMRYLLQVKNTLGLPLSRNV